MANYAKRDARRLWIEQMIANRKRPVADSSPRCHCGEKAVIGFYPGKTRPALFFCETHKEEADAMFAAGR